MIFRTSRLVGFLNVHWWVFQHIYFTKWPFDTSNGGHFTLEKVTQTNPEKGSLGRSWDIEFTLRHGMSSPSISGILKGGTHLRKLCERLMWGKTHSHNSHKIRLSTSILDIREILGFLGAFTFKKWFLKAKHFSLETTRKPNVHLTFSGLCLISDEQKIAVKIGQFLLLKNPAKKWTQVTGVGSHFPVLGSEIPPPVFLSAVGRLWTLPRLWHVWDNRMWKVPGSGAFDRGFLPGGLGSLKACFVNGAM